MAPAQTLTRTFTPRDRLDNPYPLLPFDVPEGTARLTMRYTFADPRDPTKMGPDSGSVVDLGLFDPRGCAFLDAQGFRGWSGAARSEVLLGHHEATPGYLPGPLPAGTWHVLLGLYRVAPQGCEVSVTIEVERGSVGRAAVASYASQGVLSSDRRWYRGDLHCHTHHSDATGDVASLVAAARAQGLDYLAVTEHNTVSHLPDLARQAAPDLLLIPGIEITTYRGHANVWGIRRWIDFRVTTEDEMGRIRERVRDRGLPFSINHPKDDGPPWEYVDTFDADAVEAWSALWPVSNHQSLAFWEDLLRQGSRPTLVGGSDKHQRPFDGDLWFYEVGTPTTWVYASQLSEDAILEGIRGRHVYVSHSPAGPRVSLTARAAGQEAIVGDTLRVPTGTCVAFRCSVGGAPEGSHLRVVHRPGEAAGILIEGSEWEHAWETVPQRDDYYRIEVVAPPGPGPQDPPMLALTNPVCIEVS